MRVTLGWIIAAPLGLSNDGNLASDSLWCNRSRPADKCASIGTLWR